MSFSSTIPRPSSRPAPSRRPVTLTSCVDQLLKRGIALQAASPNLIRMADDICVGLGLGNVNIVALSTSDPAALLQTLPGVVGEYAEHMPGVHAYKAVAVATPGRFDDVMERAFHQSLVRAVGERKMEAYYQLCWNTARPAGIPRESSEEPTLAEALTDIAVSVSALMSVAAFKNDLFCMRPLRQANLLMHEGNIPFCLHDGALYVLTK